MIKKQPNKIAQMVLANQFALVQLKKVRQSKGMWDQNIQNQSPIPKQRPQTQWVDIWSKKSPVPPKSSKPNMANQLASVPLLDLAPKEIKTKKIYYKKFW